MEPLDPSTTLRVSGVSGVSGGWIPVSGHGNDGGEMWGFE